MVHQRSIFENGENWSVASARTALVVVDVPHWPLLWLEEFISFQHIFKPQQFFFHS